MLDLSCALATARPARLPLAHGGESKAALGESVRASTHSRTGDDDEKAMRAFADKANRRAGGKPIMPLPARGG